MSMRVSGLSVVELIGAGAYRLSVFWRYFSCQLQYRRGRLCFHASCFAMSWCLEQILNCCCCCFSKSVTQGKTRCCLFCWTKKYDGTLKFHCDFIVSCLLYPKIHSKRWNRFDFYSWRRWNVFHMFQNTIKLTLLQSFWVFFSSCHLQNSVPLCPDLFLSHAALVMRTSATSSCAVCRTHWEYR